MPADQPRAVGDLFGMLAGEMRFAINDMADELGQPDDVQILHGQLPGGEQIFHGPADIFVTQAFKRFGVHHIQQRLHGAPGGTLAYGGRDVPPQRVKAAGRNLLQMAGRVHFIRSRDQRRLVRKLARPLPEQPCAVFTLVMIQHKAVNLSGERQPRDVALSVLAMQAEIRLPMTASPCVHGVFRQGVVMEQGADHQRGKRVVVEALPLAHEGAQDGDPHAVLPADSKLFLFNNVKSLGEEDAQGVHGYQHTASCPASAGGVIRTCSSSPSRREMRPIFQAATRMALARSTISFAFSSGTTRI